MNDLSLPLAHESFISLPCPIRGVIEEFWWVPGIQTGQTHHTVIALLWSHQDYHPLKARLMLVPAQFFFGEDVLASH